MVDKQKRMQINFRLPAVEFKKLAYSASLYGLSPSAYARKLAINAKLVKPKFNHDDAVAVNLALRRIGTNLNQLARKVNSGDLSPIQAQQYWEMKQAVDQLWQQLK